MKYAVVVYYTFDSDMKVYRFDDENEACDYMEKLWRDSLNTEIAEDETNIDFEGTYHEEYYAQIKWYHDENDVQIFQVVDISDPVRIG